VIKKIKTVFICSFYEKRGLDKSPLIL